MHTVSFLRPRKAGAIAASAALARAALSLAGVLVAGSSVFAASDTWSAAPGTGNWNTASNWVGGSNPGTGTNTDTASNTDIASFSTVSTITAVNLAAGRNMGGFRFDGAAAAYTITNTNGTFFYFTRGGSTQMTSTVTNPQNLTGASIRINSGITGGNSVYTFANNAALASATMTLGQIRNAAGAAATLVLDGTNTGNNTIAGNILELSTGVQTFSLLKQGAGNWTLAGNGNAYTGGTTVSAGTLFASANSALGTGGVNVISTGMLTLAATTTNAIADGAALTLSGTGLVNLAAATSGTLQETVGALVIDGVARAPGTYGSSTSGAANVDSHFTGNGILTVVPEPGTNALLAAAAAGALGLIVRRRRSFRH